MKSLLMLPTRSGWMVSWYTGKVTTTKRGKVIRHRDSFESTSKEKVEAKAEELRKNGFEIDCITECIF